MKRMGCPSHYQTKSPSGLFDGPTGSLEKIGEMREEAGRTESKAYEESKAEAKEVKKEVKEQKKVESYVNEEFALPSRRSRPTPPSSTSRSTSPTRRPHLPQAPHPNNLDHSSSPPLTQKPGNLAFIAFRGATSILPPIPRSRPTPCHSRKFPDSQLPRSSTSSWLRRRHGQEGVLRGR
ncbi:hypothetical protein BKA70DRAFT_460415 [Coprinopsis sp. MPI-PUGE-AT-0042]|nr:hypothetical protein BKA70DRAFT_460415 [Coprinopsis sp. MPI-PUGE-AT-0042]